MQITYNGITYNIWWHYIRDHQKDRHSYHAEHTECHIESLENAIQIITIARKAPQDKFCKEVGRKLSFGRAVKQLFPNSESCDNYMLRTLFWNTYLEQTNQASKIHDVTLFERIKNSEVFRSKDSGFEAFCQEESEL